MRALLDLALRVGPQLTLIALGLLVGTSLAAMHLCARVRLHTRLRAALRSLGEPARDPFAADGSVVTLGGYYGRDEASDGAVWMMVGGRRVTLDGPRRLLVGSVERWHATDRRSLVRGARVRARGLLQGATEAEPSTETNRADVGHWTLRPDGDVIPLAAVDAGLMRDVPYARWSLALLGVVALLLVGVTAAAHLALRRVRPVARPTAMTARGVRWEVRWSPSQRSLLAIASLSPLHRGRVRRMQRAGEASDRPVPWLDPAEMTRVESAIRANGDCGLAAEFVRRTGRQPWTDDRCDLRARIDAHPLTRAVREETARSRPDAVTLACLARDGSSLRAALADPRLPFLLRDTVRCVRDAAAACGPVGCPPEVSRDLAQLVVEHRIALRATTYGPPWRPAWWRRPSLLRANVRQLAAGGAALAVDALDLRFARGEPWPQGYTWASVAETMRGMPSTDRTLRPLVARLPGVGVGLDELNNPWRSAELNTAASGARLAAQVEWWRLGDYVPSRDVPPREREEAMLRVTAAANGRRARAVIETLGDPTPEAVEALAVVAYRITEERELVDPWLRGAAGFLPPEPGDFRARCRLRAAVRQAAQRLQRAEFLAATPWAALSSYGCVRGEASAPRPQLDDAHVRVGEEPQRALGRADAAADDDRPAAVEPVGTVGVAPAERADGDDRDAAR